MCCERRNPNRSVKITCFLPRKWKPAHCGIKKPCAPIHRQGLCFFLLFQKPPISWLVKLSLNPELWTLNSGEFICNHNWNFKKARLDYWNQGFVPFGVFSNTGQLWLRNYQLNTELWISVNSFKTHNWNCEETGGDYWNQGFVPFGVFSNTGYLWVNELSTEPWTLWETRRGVVSDVLMPCGRLR